jgi:excisionase family DNA binding protein
MTQTEAFVPIDKLAEHLHVRVSTVRQWVKNGTVPRHTYLKIGNTYRFHISAVVQALQVLSREASLADDAPIPADVDPNMPVQLEFDFGPDNNDL